MKAAYNHDIAMFALKLWNVYGLARIDTIDLFARIDAHTNAAVLAERDACAKECDYVANMQCNGASAAYLDGHQIAAQVITQRIRARGEV